MDWDGGEQSVILLRSVDSVVSSCVCSESGVLNCGECLF